MPLRRKNLAEMRIGEHFQVEEGSIRLLFTTSLKNREIIDSNVPGFLVPYFTTYLQRHRQTLLQGQQDAAARWINLEGRALDYDAMRGVFEKMGKRILGEPITVHALRHACATFLLDEDPRATRTASRVLAHRGTATVNRVYDRSGNAGANQQWAKMVNRRYAR